jgi:hypothetical protein
MVTEGQQKLPESPRLVFYSLGSSIIVIISIQPLGLILGRNQSPFRRPVLLWQTVFLRKFLGIVCHCFPLPLEVPTFAARCFHVPINASAPSSERWNCGREFSGNFAEMTPVYAI